MTLTERPRRDRLRRRLPGARVLRDGTVLYWWVEILAIAIFYFVYSQVRNANGNDPTAAFANATDIIHWQQLLGIYHEQTLQAWALHFRPIIVFCNYFYGSMHFIVTTGVMIFLYRKWSDDYPTWRNTLGIATAIALIGFTLFPLMPPRLLPAHYGFDPLTHYTTFWTINGVKSISNQFAAMPSVHCEWALWSRVRPDPPTQADVGEVARRHLPGDHGDRDRPHRQPLLPRRRRRVRRARRRRPARSPVRARPARARTRPVRRRPVATEAPGDGHRVRRWTSITSRSRPATRARSSHRSSATWAGSS